MPDADPRDTVNEPVLATPSEPPTSSIDKLEGLSSSVIVKVPEASEILAFEAFDKVTVTVSLFSSTVSLRIGTTKVLDVSPAAKVNKPVVAV